MTIDAKSCGLRGGRHRLWGNNKPDYIRPRRSCLPGARAPGLVIHGYFEFLHILAPTKFSLCTFGACTVNFPAYFFGSQRSADVALVETRRNTQFSRF